MEYQLLDEDGKLEIRRRRLHGLESEHYNNALSLELLDMSAPGAEQARIQVEAKLRALEGMILKLRGEDEGSG